MEKLKQLIDAWGIAWDILIISMFIAAFLVWMDVVIGNKVRLSRSSLAGILLDTWMNKYILIKKKAEAKSLQLVTGYRQYIVNIGGHVFVISKKNRQRINKLLKKHNTKITIYELLADAIWWTK